MHLLWQILVNGTLLGGLYALMALGLALVWGVLNIVNLSHGALIMLGAYVCYYLFTVVGLDPFIALPIVMLVLFCFGYLLQRYVINLVIRAPIFNSLLITFGLEVIIINMAQILFSADYRIINPSYAGANFLLLGVSIPLVRILAFGIAIFLTFALWLFLSYTRMGLAIRATSQNLVAARLYGVNPRQLYALTFALGAALAGAAGSLYGVVSQVNPYMGLPLTPKCFAIAIIGGLDNTLYIIAGGIFLGLVEALTALYIGPTFIDVVSFGILVMILILRPTGLLGRGTS
jgi:branched-chain amino acid transport system permease protein